LTLSKPLYRRDEEQQVFLTSQENEQSSDHEHNWFDEKPKQQETKPEDSPKLIVTKSPQMIR